MRRWTGALVLACVIVWSSSVQAEVVDRIVAVVEDDAIFLSELERRVRPFERQLTQVPDGRERATRREQVFRETLERMIDDAVIRRAATRAQVNVTPADVDRMIHGLAQQRGVSEQDIYAAVESEGVTRAEYRRVMEAEVLRLRLMNVRVRGRVNITSTDIVGEYRRRTRQAADRAPFHLAHLFLAFPENPTATQIAEVRARSEALRDQLNGGSEFGALVAAHSEDSSSRESAGDLGVVDPDNPDAPAPEWLVNAVRSLQPGQISTVTRGENGFHIFRLLSRQPPEVPQLEAVRDELYNELLNREMARQQRIYLRELRQRASVDVRL